MNDREERAVHRCWKRWETLAELTHWNFKIPRRFFVNDTHQADIVGDDSA